jgi:hypothetical protein
VGITGQLVKCFERVKQLVVEWEEDDYEEGLELEEEEEDDDDDEAIVIK